MVPQLAVRSARAAVFHSSSVAADPVLGLATTPSLAALLSFFSCSAFSWWIPFENRFLMTFFKFMGPRSSTYFLLASCSSARSISAQYLQNNRSAFLSPTSGSRFEDSYVSQGGG